MKNENKKVPQHNSYLSALKHLTTHIRWKRLRLLHPDGNSRASGASESFQAFQLVESPTKSDGNLPKSAFSPE